MIKKIAITGGIGSGKSLVSEYLQKLGFQVFSCDKIYKKLINDAEYVREISKLFPEVVENNAINLKTLADIVFTNDEKREILNNLAHPLIMNTLFKRINESEAEIVFAEVPLLFEGGFEKNFDYVFVILREQALRVADIQRRDNISKAKAQLRIQSQFDYESEIAQERLNQAHIFKIENNGSKEALFETIEKKISAIK